MIIHLGIDPHPGQVEVMNCLSRFITVCCGRRWGKTVIAARKILQWLYSPDSKRNQRGWVVAPTYLLTREIEREIVSVIQPLMLSQNKSERSYKLMGGHLIEFRSADSENLVGAGLDWILLDEAALISGEIWQRYLRPTLTDKKGKGLFISTPRGSDWFKDMFLWGQDILFPEHASFHFPSSSNPYLSEEELNNARKELPELIWRQEYLAEFLDDATSFFRSIEKAIYGGYKYENNPSEIKMSCQKCGHRFAVDASESRIKCILCGCIGYIPTGKKPVFFIGVDLAKDVDFSVISVIRYHPEENILWQVYLDRFNSIDYTVQKERIINVYERFKGLVVMDGTGVGAPIVDDLQYAGIPVMGVKFTNENKLKMCSKLSVLFEQEKIKILDSTTQEQELKIFTSERLPSGKMRLTAPAGKHDDCVIALGLSVMETPALV